MKVPVRGRTLKARVKNPQAHAMRLVVAWNAPFLVEFAELRRDHLLSSDLLGQQLQAFAVGNPLQTQAKMSLLASL